MLTIHHLGHAQSERILWLCEELGLPYELRLYVRDPVTRLSSPELRALHPLGAAPLLDDGDLRLAESGAIVEYILARYGAGRLRPAPEDPDFAEYLYWFHLSNGNLQPALGRSMMVGAAGLGAEHPVQRNVEKRLGRVLNLVEARLGKAPYLAGERFTAADIMSVFSLTTMRLFQPFELAAFPNMRRYLRKIGERPAYGQAMAKGDPDLEPMLK